MSAAEVIELIKKLPPAEQQEVAVYLEKKKQAAPTERPVRYISKEKFDEIVPKVFEKHDELLRRLAQ